MNFSCCTFCNLFTAIQGMMQELNMDHVRKDHPAESNPENEDGFMEYPVNISSVDSSNDTINCDTSIASQVDVQRGNFCEQKIMNTTPKVFINNEESMDNCHDDENEFNIYNNYSDDETYKNTHMDSIGDTKEKVMDDQVAMTGNRIVPKFSDSKDLIYSLEALVNNEPVNDGIQNDWNEDAKKHEKKLEGIVLRIIKIEQGINNLNVAETVLDHKAENIATTFQNEVKESKVITDPSMNISFSESTLNTRKLITCTEKEVNKNLHEDEHSFGQPTNIRFSKSILKTNINKHPHKDGDILKQFSREENKSQLEEMKLEMEMEDMKSNFTCNICATKFSDKKQLNDHRKKNHKVQVSKMDEVGYWNCNFCFEKFPSNRHLQDHRREKNHYKVNKMNEDGYWKCNICSERFSTKRQLSNHRGEVHRTSKTSLKYIKDGEKDDDGFWKCNYCTMRLPFRKKLIEHVTEYHKSECPDRYNCTVCGRGFRKEETYRHHVKIHEEKTFQCLECSKVYNTNLSLYIHVKNMHRHVELFTCETCGQRMKYKNKLIQHINVVHKKIKRFKCINCSSCFGSKSVFQSHCKFKHKVENKEAAEKILKVLPVRD